MHNSFVEAFTRLTFDDAAEGAGENQRPPEGTGSHTRVDRTDDERSCLTCGTCLSLEKKEGKIDLSGASGVKWDEPLCRSTRVLEHACALRAYARNRGSNLYCTWESTGNARLGTSQKARTRSCACSFTRGKKASLLPKVALLCVNTCIPAWGSSLVNKGMRMYMIFLGPPGYFNQRDGPFQLIGFSWISRT